MTKKIPMYQVDAFAKQVFGGNPAAVCVLDAWLEDAIMQNIAAENNLAETAFVVSQGEGYAIRWFTPVVEVDLCGHATLAAAHVLFHYYNAGPQIIHLHSPRSGALSVEKTGEQLTLDFPTDECTAIDCPPILVKALGQKPTECYKGKTDYLLIYNNQKEIEALQPNFALILEGGGRGLIVSAPGDSVDFVSRFFAPQVGVDEDPVTGSAHTTLTPVWHQKLGKKVMTAKQLSKRQGELTCEYKGDRVKISGYAVTYLKGEIELL